MLVKDEIFAILTPLCVKASRLSGERNAVRRLPAGCQCFGVSIAVFVVPSAGVEPAAKRLEGSCSIR